MSYVLCGFAFPQKTNTWIFPYILTQVKARRTNEWSFTIVCVLRVIGVNSREKEYKSTHKIAKKNPSGSVALCAFWRDTPESFTAHHLPNSQFWT